jgi:GNAT superfamily N-acetyltransferase
MVFNKITISEADSRYKHKKFVCVPWVIYRDDPRWIPPLLLDKLETIDPKKNPFFDHGEAALFLAKKDGEYVGRISAHINHLHNEYHNEKAGFFGFFESINNKRVSRALLERAEEWLKNKGCEKILGPISFCTSNGEVGLLVKGFDKPLMFMCPYNPPYYEELITDCKYEKAKDMFGWMLDLGEIPTRALQVARQVEQYPGLRIRPMEPNHLEKEIKIVSDIFNSAWSRNWGYVPWTKKEVEHLGRAVKLILIKEMTAIAELDGEPIGMMLILPNIMEVIKDINGRLFPTGFLKLLYRIKMGAHKFKTGRLPLLGVKPEYQGSALKGLSVLLYVQAYKSAAKYGLKSGESGWTLEDNEKINNGIKLMGGRPEKVYRVYAKDT